MLGDLLGPDIHEMLEQKRLRELREALLDIPPYDIADLIVDLSAEDKAIVFRILPRALASDVFEQLSVSEQESLLSALGQQQCRQILDEMDPDDRTAMLEELPARVTRKIMRLLSPEERRVAQTLLAYPEESVGRLMTPYYIDLRAGMTAGAALAFIRQVGMDKETVYDCYVTGPGHVLEGVVSLKNLVLAPDDAPVEDLMAEAPGVLLTTDDQEAAVRVMSDYDLLAAPVVDPEQRLVGIVTIDDMTDVFEEETSEDIQIMAGVLPETQHSYLEQRLLGISWRRSVPLMILLVGEFFAAMVLHGFAVQIETIVALSFFIPMVMATGGGTGVQTATLIVRGLASGEITPRDWSRTLLREIAVTLVISFCVGAFAFALCYVLIGVESDLAADFAGGNLAVKLGATIFSAMLLVMLLAVTAGVLLPLLFQRLKLDPALMTSPILTSSVDALGLLIYFQTARFIFRI